MSFVDCSGWPQNLLARKAMLLLQILFFTAVFYHVAQERDTADIVIGGAAGAFPPVDRLISPPAASLSRHG